MEYHGKLYGKYKGRYFDTGRTSTDYDELLEALNELYEHSHFSVYEKDQRLRSKCESIINKSNRAKL